jgi:hypothetical protein
MLSAASFSVFKKYKNAKSHPFFSGEVTEDDKDVYQNIFETLIASANESIVSVALGGVFTVRSARFSRDGGVQGQRPIDLWASAINKESENVGNYPQLI